MQHSARTAFLFQPDPDQRGLLRSLLADLGINTELQSVSQMHEVLNELLLIESRTGKHLVLVIDEAQDLDDSVLESVRLLSNFETPQAKLMHIVLAGQPALANRLAKPELKQLRQRVAAWAGLSPLSAAECADYIDHRLRVGGYRGTNLFPATSKSLIASASCGLPRNINHICFGCLSLGFANQEQQMHTGIVREVLRDQEFHFKREEKVDLKSSGHAAETPYLPPIPVIPPVRHPQHIGGVLLGLVGIPLLLIFLASEFKTDYFNPQILRTGDDIALRSGGPNLHGGEGVGNLPLPAPPSVDLTPRIPAAHQELPFAAVRPATPPHVRWAATKVRPVPHQVPAARHSPRVVIAQKRETLFQLAMDNYGKANWEIIGQIRAKNPGIKDSFAYVDQGQRVALPDLAPQFPWKNE
jgi:phage tail protein X